MYFGPHLYTSITFTPEIQRKGAFYMVNLICPCMFMAVMATCSFYLPPESKEKASLAATMFLSQMVFDIIIVQYLPSQSEVMPIIGRRRVGPVRSQCVTDVRRVKVVCFKEC